jgi:hypothetical protein
MSSSSAKDAATRLVGMSIFLTKNLTTSLTPARKAAMRLVGMTLMCLGADHIKLLNKKNEPTIPRMTRNPVIQVNPTNPRMMNPGMVPSRNCMPKNFTYNELGVYFNELVESGKLPPDDLDGVYSKDFLDYLHKLNVNTQTSMVRSLKLAYFLVNNCLVQNIQVDPEVSKSNPFGKLGALARQSMGSPPGSPHGSHGSVSIPDEVIEQLIDANNNDERFNVLDKFIKASSHKSEQINDLITVLKDLDPNEVDTDEMDEILKFMYDYAANLNAASMEAPHAHSQGTESRSARPKGESGSTSSVSVASGSVASGSVASGSVASGSVASGSVASGSVASGSTASAFVSAASGRAEKSGGWTYSGP